MSQLERKNYNALDVGKFIAATMIILLHVNPFESMSNTLGAVFRSMIFIMAVPFFFTTGGFLFYEKVFIAPTEGNRILKKYVVHLAKLYLIWSAIYFPFVALEWNKNGIALGTYLRDFFFEGSFSTIWYLPASIVATIFTYYLYRRASIKTSILICGFFYLVGCGFSYYYYILHSVPIVQNVMDVYYFFFETTKNGILFGAIFIELGLVLAMRKRWASKQVCILGCIGFGLLLAAESGILPLAHIPNKGVDLKLFLVPFTFCLVMFLAQLNLKDKTIYRWMRKMSTNMFLSQRLFITAYPLLLPNGSVWVTSNWRFFILVYCSTLVFSELLIIIGKILQHYRAGGRSYE